MKKKWKPGRCPLGKAREVLETLVKRDTGACIVWPYSVIHDGYGRVRVGNKTIQAHRLSFEITRGPIPPGLCVLHTCDNPPCVNPKHLFLGTNMDNDADRVKKNRQAQGERHGRAKVNNEIVKAIREEYVFGSSTRGTPALAKKYGLHQTSVYNIVSGAHWKGIA